MEDVGNKRYIRYEIHGHVERVVHHFIPLPKREHCVHAFFTSTHTLLCIMHNIFAGCLLHVVIPQ